MSDDGTRGTSTVGIATATHIAWGDWLAWLEAQGAAEKPHPEIAALARSRIERESRGSAAMTNPGWWGQGIAVAYEQHIGRRVPGQSGDGTFSAAASRTVAGTMDDALAALSARFEGRTGIDGVAFAGEPTTSATEKWRYWRVALADGTKVDTTINDQGKGRARIGVQHAKLDSPAAAARWKAVWKSVLSEI